MKLGCFSVQVIFRYLCEEGHHVISEKQFFPAVRELATKLILSGKTESGRNWSLSCRMLTVTVITRVSGELHTYEALSSDLHRNILSGLRRLEIITKLRGWVMRLAAENLFGFKLVFCSGWKAGSVSSSQVRAEWIQGEQGGCQKNWRHSL